MTSSSTSVNGFSNFDFFIKRKKTLDVINLSVFLFLIVCLATNFLVENFQSFDINFSEKRVINFGSLYWPYTLYIILFFAISFIILYFQYTKEKDATKKKQLELIFSGIFITVATGIITNLVLPSFGDFNYYWLGPIFPSVMAVFITIAIVRHRLLNTKIITTELLTFTLWIAILTRVLLTLRTTNNADFFFNLILLISTIIFGIFLIRSVLKEVQTREALETVLHFMSHEVKGALGKTRGLLSFIQDGTLGEVSPKLREMSGDLMRTVTESLDSSEDILNSSNIKRGTFTYQMAPFDFTDLVTNLVNVYKPQAEHKNLLFTYNTPSAPITLVGDQKHLAHVAKNLIDNAVRYTKQGSITVTITNGEKAIQLRVADTGYGLTEEDKKTLFTEGGKGKESQKVNTESTGYGLFIVKSIVIAHGGRVWAESAGRDQGSTFIVELPKKELPNTPITPQVKLAQPVTQPTPQPSTSSNLPTTPQSVALSPKESKE
jgi:signal transduction histidine kinase